MLTSEENDQLEDPGQVIHFLATHQKPTLMLSRNLDPGSNVRFFCVVCPVTSLFLSCEGLTPLAGSPNGPEEEHTFSTALEASKGCKDP